MTEPKICAYALGHLNHQNDNNRVSACYRCVAELGNHKTQLMSEIMNSTAAKEHRLTLMRGEWPEGCGSCRDFEENGLVSTRLQHINNPNLDLNLDHYNAETGEIKYVKSIELRFGNECNLTCRHCSPTYSSRWDALVKQDHTLWESALGRPAQNVPDNRLNPKYLKDILDNLVPTLQHIMISGGEPLYQKSHYKFLESIPAEHASHISLLYVTNGTATSHGRYNVLELWKKFKKVTVFISTDGVGDLFNYFRVGADWQSVEQNIAQFKAAGCTVMATITCSVYQMFHFVDILNYLYDNNIVGHIISSVVQFPPMLNPRIIPTPIKLDLLQRWETYLKSITDPVKLEAIKYAGSNTIEYMMGPIEQNGYELGTDSVPSWSDFSKSVIVTDKLFGTDIKTVSPELAKLLSF